MTRRVTFVLRRFKCGHAAWTAKRRVGYFDGSPSFPWSRYECIDCAWQPKWVVREAEIRRLLRVFMVMVDRSLPW